MNTNLTENESSFLRHMTMWGSDGYPVQKIGRKWVWNDFCGIHGAPTMYRTKKEAAEAVERYIAILCDKAAGREDRP